MRLPQNRILHIDTEFVDGKVNVTAEWQGELVRCKDCRYFHNGDCYNGNFPIKGDLADVYFDMKETDFCSYGERKGGDEDDKGGAE